MKLPRVSPKKQKKSSNKCLAVARPLLSAAGLRTDSWRPTGDDGRGIRGGSRKRDSAESLPFVGFTPQGISTLRRLLADGIAQAKAQVQT